MASWMDEFCPSFGVTHEIWDLEMFVHSNFEDLEVEFNYILRYKNQCPNVISESFHIFGVYMIFCCWGLLENDSIPGLNC